MSDETMTELVESAKRARLHAYCPYTHYAVGAAVLTKTGEIFSGCNIENAAITPTVHAEQCAISKAVSDGHKEFVAIAVVTRDGGAPCGLCRQIIKEFCSDDCEIFCSNESVIISRHTLGEILPCSFGPDNLKN